MGHSEFVHSWQPPWAKSPVTMRQWNPDPESIAAFFEVDPDRVDIIEADNGSEIVTINGEPVGTIEWVSAPTNPTKRAAA